MERNQTRLVRHRPFSGGNDGLINEHVNNTTFDDIEMSYDEMLEVTGGTNNGGNTDGDNGELVSDMHHDIGVNGKNFTDETSSGEENDG